jgi:hypothetical protein
MRAVSLPGGEVGQRGRRLCLDDVEPAGQGKQVNQFAGRCSFHHAASWSISGATQKVRPLTVAAPSRRRLAKAANRRASTGS